jgi:hypothetical protein
MPSRSATPEDGSALLLKRPHALAMILALDALHLGEDLELELGIHIDA